MLVVISGLYIYPIKSCAAIAVDSMMLDELGAANDRRYMLVDEYGQFLSQRQCPQLVHVQVRFHAEGWQVTLPAGNSRILPREGLMQDQVAVTVWSDTFSAYHQGDEWAGFFSDFLGKKVRLVFAANNTARRIDPRYCQTVQPVSFADGFPLLLANEQSLHVLNTQLHEPIHMLRFRPNIVVRGAAAFEENSWLHLRTRHEGNALLDLAVVKPCSRCVIPTINPDTAKKQPEVWKALAALCKGEDGNVYFGQNVIHNSIGRLSIGDELQIVR